MTNHGKETVGTEEPRGITARQAAEMIGVTPTWLRVMVRRGEFVPPIRIGTQRMRFLRSDVMAWIEERKAV